MGFYNGLLTRGASNPILRNEVGTYDELKVGPADVRKVGAGDYRMWYEGIINSGADSPTLPCYATSPDGTVWTKYVSNPIMDGSVAWEKNEASPVSVLYDPDAAIWKMWYHGGNNSGPRQVGYATSSDGITWTKYAGNPVFSGAGIGSGAWDEWVADAKVIRFGPTDYRMWYHGVNGSGIGRQGYATSTDGITWTKYSGNPVIDLGAAGTWNDGHIFCMAPLWDPGQSKFHAWVVGADAPTGYNTAIGYYSSPDGIVWTQGPANPVLSPIAGDTPTDSITAYWENLRVRIVYGQYDMGATPILRGKGEAYIDPAETETVTISIATGSKDGHITRESSPRVWPPTGAITVNTTNSNPEAIYARKVWHPDWNFSECALGGFIFDTSSIPDDAIITSAKLQLVISGRTAVGGFARNLDFEWYDWGGSLDSADWSENVTPNAASIPYATWIAFSLNTMTEISLSDPDTHIVKNGETGIKMAFASGSLSGSVILDDNLSCYSLENPTYAEPKLSVTYRLPTTYFGSSALPVTFGKEIAATRKTFGQTISPVTFGKETVAKRTTFGLIDFPIIFTKEASGINHLYGQLSMPTFFGKETAGSRTTFAQFDFPMSFSKEISALKETFGQISLPIDFLRYVSGRGFAGERTLFGRLSFPIVFGKEISALKTTFGQISRPINFNKETYAHKKTFGQTSLPINFLSVVDGIIDIKTIYGSLSLPFIFGKEMSAFKETFGQSSLPIIVELDTKGRVEIVGLILNNVDMIYLGSSPVVAIYVKNQKVWP